jgi:site-specific DNA recombinase
MKVVKDEDLRVAFYARFSSDLQKDKSIPDQFAELERAAKRFPFKVDKRHYYFDRAVCAASLFDRPGLTRKLLGAAERGEIDAVFVEATDRLSRKRADTFWLADQLKFFNVKIFTPTGEVDDFRLTFEGHSNEDFSKKLAVRVKRGHNANTREGKFAGGKCYGYDNLPGAERVINAEQAKIINRICLDYVSGDKSRNTPRKLCAGLQRDGILSPTGRTVWNWQYIVRLLDNELYRGKIVRNRFKKVRDPRNGKKVSRPGDADDLIVVDAPHLRIISDELWNAVQARRGARRAQMNPAGTRPTLVRKPHLILDLMRCASCNGKMTSLTKGIIVCSNARYRETCDHTKSYKLDLITPEVIKKVDEQLTDPEFLKRRVRARALELAKAAKEENEERDTAQRKLDRVSLRIKQLVAMSADLSDVEEITAEIKAKEAERVALRERLRLLGQGSKVLTIPDATMSVFGKNVEKLVKLIRRNPDDSECRLALENLIDCVLVHPTPKKRPYELSLYARVSAVGNLELFPAVRTHEKIVAEEGVRKFYGLDNSGTSI